MMASATILALRPTRAMTLRFGLVLAELETSVFHQVAKRVALCVSFGGKNSGSVILTFYGTDDQSGTVVISSARILLQGSSLLTTEEKSERRDYLKPQGKKRE